MRRASRLLLTALLTWVTGLLVLPRAPAQQPAPARHGVEALLQELRGFHQRLLSVPALHVVYRVDNEVLPAAARSSELWPWRWAEVSNSLRPADAGRLAVTFRHPGMDSARKTMGQEAPASTDGSVQEETGTAANGVCIELGAAATPPRVKLTRVNDFFLPAPLRRTYYFQYLGYGGNALLERSLDARTFAPPGHYWLPAALEKETSYRVRPAQEQVDGVWCHVLERPGDRLWVQVEPHWAIRRRTFTWGNSGYTNHDLTFADFQEVASGVYLPRAVAVTKCAAPWDDPPSKGQPVCRLRLAVTKLSAEALPDEHFRATIPRGAVVADFISNDKGQEFVYAPGTNPFEQATGVLTPAPREQHPWGVLLGILALEVAVMAYFCHLAFRRKSARQPADAGRPAP